jgi:hypothetical protein
MRIWIALVLSLAACHKSSPHKQADAGIDGGTDGGLPPTLCTTAACAASPCTADCIYAAKTGACAGAMPSEVATAKVLSCENRCGLRYPPYGNGSNEGATGSGYCWQFNATAPGCVIPTGCGYSSGQCYPTDDGFDEGGASICADGWTCTDGATVPPDDLSLVCDMTVVD